MILEVIFSSKALLKTSSSMLPAVKRLVVQPKEWKLDPDRMLLQASRHRQPVKPQVSATLGIFEAPGWRRASPRCWSRQT